MARARKRHVQLELRRPDKNGQWRGGARKGAGRPKQGRRASERHVKRPVLKRHEGVHVVLRTVREVGALRRLDIYRAVRGAMVVAGRRAGFRIVHLSVQGTHIHLIVEAEDRMALARGMRAFEISAARRINAAITKRTGVKRTGTVFPDRYHARIIRTPREARHALAYVLNNWRKHGEDRDAAARKHGWRVDPFSTAPSFDGWRDLDVRGLVWPPTYEPLPAVEPRTWLLRVGWRRHGLVGTNDVPSQQTAGSVAVIAE